MTGNFRFRTDSTAQEFADQIPRGAGTKRVLSGEPAVSGFEGRVDYDKALDDDHEL